MYLYTSVWGYVYMSVVVCRGQNSIRCPEEASETSHMALLVFCRHSIHYL